MMLKISIAALHALHACSCHSDSDAQGKSRVSMSILYEQRKPFCVCVCAPFYAFDSMSPLSPVPLCGSVENLRPLSNLPLCLAHETHTL